MESMNLMNELLKAMEDGLEISLIPQRMNNEEKTLKTIKIRVIDYRDLETVSVSREVFVDAIKLKNMSVEKSLAAEILAAEIHIARIKVIE